MALWNIKLARGKKANLPQLSLGEPAYVTDEGELYIGGVNGENINITNNGTIKATSEGLTSFKKQTVSDGDKNYYVSTTGDDNTGDGSQERPFRTIQRACVVIPRLITNIFNIIILDGTYEGFSLYSIGGSGLVNIKSNSGNRDNVIVSHCDFNHCENTVVLDGITINNTSKHKITVYGCQRLELKNLKIESPSTYDGIFSEYSNCFIHDSIISNQDNGITSTVCSNILAQNCSGSGNKTALRAIYGGVIAKDNNTITGTTQENVGIGGVIR